MWVQFDNGATIGSKGSEDGIIVLDEEHIEGARITLEHKGTTAPWSVTCGIYGSLFLHTAFASTETEGKMKYEKMKADLVDIMQEQDDEQGYCMMRDFTNRY
jgi:hypothetical protein